MIKSFVREREKKKEKKEREGERLNYSVWLSTA
jgi:hypothetical protein